MIRVLSLVENTADKAGLLGEHGLSMWIEIDGRSVLFDTGQGLALIRNAQALGVQFEKSEAIVLSHGHYDHTGGLSLALELARNAKVYAHPEAFRRRYAHGPLGVREVGISEKNRDAAFSRGVGVIETLAPTEVIPGLFATGPVPKRTSYEETSGPFVLDKDCRQADPLTDDQALFIDSKDGVVALLGCAHAGVVNNLKYIQELTDGRPVCAVIGGMHLRAATPERIEATLRAFDQMDIRMLCPAHCTGMRAAAAMWNRFPDACETWSVGARRGFASKAF